MMLLATTRPKRRRLPLAQDWRKRALPSDMKRYAALDVHYLLFLAARLASELAQVGHHQVTAQQQATGKQNTGRHKVSALSGNGMPQNEETVAAFGASGGGATATGGSGQDSATADGHAASQVMTAQAVASSALVATMVKSHQLSLRLYHQPSHEEAVAAAAATLWRKYLASGATKAVATAVRLPSGSPAVTTDEACIYALCRWRDEQARQADESPSWVLPDAAMLQLVQQRPATSRALLHLVRACVVQLNADLASVCSPSAPLHHHVSPEVRRDARQLCDLLSATAASIRGSWWDTRSGADGTGGTSSGRFGDSSSSALPGQHSRRDGASADVVSRRQLKRQWVIDQFTVKKTQVYEGCRMLSLAGELLCHCDQRKLNWYLDKGLAEPVAPQDGDDPPTIRLLFEHKVGDQASGADAFYTHSKLNACVVCGESEHFLRYRVVPACYRRFLPPALKSHRSHDVVLLCVDDHEVAHKAAEGVKRRIACELGIPLLPGCAVPQLSLGTGRTPVAGRVSSAVSGTAEGIARPADTDECDAAGGGTSGGDMDALSGRPYDVQEGEEERETVDGTLVRQGGSTGQASSSTVAKKPELWTARAAALALQRQSKLPEWRVRQLEAVILQYLGRDVVDSSSDQPVTLQPGDLEKALLAGLTGRALLRASHRLNAGSAEGTGQTLHGNGGTDSAAGTTNAADGSTQDESDESGAAGGVSNAPNAPGSTCSTMAVDGSTGGTAGGQQSRQHQNGQLWHGEQVVRRLMELQGEEGLLELMRRFRFAFVDACRPRHLPASWGVDHSARREFGQHSVFSATSGAPT